MAAHRRVIVAALLLPALMLPAACSQGEAATMDVGVVTETAVVAAEAAPAIPMPTPNPVVEEADVAMDTAFGESAATAAGVEMMGSAPEAVAEAAAREVITTGFATLAAPDPIAAASELAALTEHLGGRVETRQETRANDFQPASAYLVLRIPSAQINTTIDSLSDLGEVRDVSINREDVTAIGTDLDARINALHTSVDRLTTLMAEATNTDNLLRVEQELSRRQADLDSLRSTRAGLSDQVAMSTLQVQINSTDTPVLQPPPEGFLGGLARGWRALANFGRGLLVVIGAVLPWLVALALLGLLVRWLVRLIRRRRPAKAATENQRPFWRTLRGHRSEQPTEQVERVVYYEEPNLPPNQ